MSSSPSREHIDQIYRRLLILWEQITFSHLIWSMHHLHNQMNNFKHIWLFNCTTHILGFETDDNFHVLYLMLSLSVCIYLLAIQPISFNSLSQRIYLYLFQFIKHFNHDFIYELTEYSVMDWKTCFWSVCCNKLVNWCECKIEFNRIFTLIHTHIHRERARQRE